MYELDARKLGGLHDRTGRLEKDYIAGFSAVELHDRTGRLENHS